MLDLRRPPEWTISIKYNLKGQTPSAKLIVRETILDEATQIADDEVKKSGHICDGACQDWKVLSEYASQIASN